MPGDKKEKKKEGKKKQKGEKPARKPACKLKSEDQPWYNPTSPSATNHM